MDAHMDPVDSVEELASTIDLADGVYASEETLHSSVAFLRTTLAGLGFCQDLNLLSSDPADVVSVCNTIYGLLLQHQRDSKFKEQLKHDLHRMRVDLQGADRERQRLEGRVQAKEREIGTLMNKQKASEEQRKGEVKAAKREAEELGKRLVGVERRVVQMQHEIRRKEKEYERLQERLAHYLADKKKNEKAVVEMAGKLTQQLGGGGGGAGAAGRTAASRAATDEGLKAVVAAYEQKQAELAKDNRDFKASLAALQAEYKDMLNRQVRQQQADASSSAAAVDDSFLQRMGSLSEEELRSELSSRIKALQRRVAGLPSSTTQEKDLQSISEQRLWADLQAAQEVVRDQERLVGAMLGALRSSQAAAAARHQADAKRLAQHYQAQLAAAEAEIQRAKETQAEVAQGEVESLQQQMAEVREAVRAKAEAETAAIRLQAEAQAAELRRQLEQERQQAAAAAHRAQEERQRAQESDAARDAARDAAVAAQQAQGVAVAAEVEQRFAALRATYQDLMRMYAPGVGAGIFLERAVSRKAQELAASQVSGEESQGSIAAVHP